MVMCWQVRNAATTTNKQLGLKLLTLSAFLLLGLTLPSQLPTASAASKHLLNATWQAYAFSPTNETSSFALPVTSRPEPSVTLEKMHSANAHLDAYINNDFAGDVVLQHSAVEPLPAPSEAHASENIVGAYKSDVPSQPENSPMSSIDRKNQSSRISVNAGGPTVPMATRSQVPQRRQNPSSQADEGLKRYRREQGANSNGVDVAEEPRQRSRRAATSESHRLWPNGLIPFEISSSLSSATKVSILKAMRIWEKNTCLSFVDREAGRQSHLYFTVKACGCCSSIGRQYYRTEISIGSGCASVGIILHEIGHAIGFWHEHTRPDRDAFVKIHWDQIDGQYRRNFNLKNSGEIDSLGEPYDYDSIMHYGRNSFAKSKDSETITPKAGMAAIGQRKGLSPGDIRQTNKLYRCDLRCREKLKGNEGAFTSPNYPNPYLPDMDCSWSLKVPVGSFITLTFISFKLEMQSECEFDYLAIYDGASINSPLLAKICGDDKPKPVNSTANKMFVRFKSDPSNELEGFSALFRKNSNGSEDRAKRSVTAVLH